LWIQAKRELKDAENAIIGAFAGTTELPYSAGFQYIPV
jgi:hypothetical protein